MNSNLREKLKMKKYIEEKEMFRTEIIRAEKTKDFLNGSEGMTTGRGLNTIRNSSHNMRINTFTGFGKDQGSFSSSRPHKQSPSKQFRRDSNSPRGIERMFRHTETGNSHRL